MSVFGTTKYTSKLNTTQNPCLGNAINTGAGDLIIVGFSGANSPTGVPTDTVGNTYVLDATNGFIINGFGTRQYMYYCLGSIGANAANVISIAFSGAISGTVQVWDIPLTGGTALFDVCSKLGPASGTNPSVAAFNTAGTDEYVAIGVCTSGTWASEATAGGSYTLDGAAVGAGITHFAGEHFIYSSTQTSITPGFTQASNANSAQVAVAIKANPLFSISGSASAGAVIHYLGTASGTVTADGSGNWTISNLSNGSYTLFPTCAFFSFSPLTSSQTVSGSNITGVTFTATASAFGNPVIVGGTASAAPTVTATSNTSARDLIVVTACGDRNTGPSGVTDTVGNTYTQAGTVTQLPTGTTYVTVWYCAKSIGANASNVVTVTYAGNTTGSMTVANVALAANKKAVFDTNALGSSTSGTAMVTASFNTAGADEIVLVSGSCNGSSPVYTPQNGYLIDNSGSGLAASRIGSESVRFGATQTGITSTLTTTPGGNWVVKAVAFSSADDVFAVSGTVLDGSSVAISGVTISWTGTSSGSTTTDGSGNWTTSLINGTYTFTPSKTGYTFSPISTGETVNGAAITGVNFTGTLVFLINGNAGTCGATLTLSGSSSGTATADSSGDYSFLLPNGTYTITPSKTGKTFSPTSQTKVISGSGFIHVDFFLVLDGITLTPVYTNTLTGANQNPVDPTNLDPSIFAPMQVLSAVGQGTDNTAFNEAAYIGAPSLGNDQYGSITVHAWVSGGSNDFDICLRCADGTAEDCYAVSVFDNNDGTATIQADAFVSNVSVQSLYSNAAAALPVACDSFTFAVVGTSIALYKNSSQIFVATSTHRSTGIALISLSTPSPNPLTNLTVTNMIFGNASGLLPPPAPPSRGGSEMGFNDDFMF